MSTTALQRFEEALADGSSADDVLDAADDAIEQATRDADTATLTALADRLDAVVAERGGEWRMLAIAAMRARAVAGVPTVDERVAPTVTAPAPPTDEATPVPRYAGWWIRTVAFLIDCALLGVAYGIFAEVTSDDGGGALGAIVWLGLPLAYFAGMHAANAGATAGKAVFGIALRLPDECRVGVGRAIGRAVGTTILWATIVGGLIDALVLGTDRRKQAVHDKIAGTVVVRTRGR